MTDHDSAAQRGLPELPEPRAIRAGHAFPKVYALAYTADMMRAYALAASQLQPAASLREQEDCDLEDLSAIADGLDGYEKTVNVGNTTGEGDEHIESTTAAAARFIRGYIDAQRLGREKGVTSGGRDL